MKIRMNRFALLLFIPLLASCSRGSERTPSGPIDRSPVLEKINTAEGKLQGQYLRYSSTGLLEVSCNYLDGKLDGPVIYYYPDGKSIAKTATYKDGVLSGRENLYYPDGTLKTSFINDSGVITNVTCYYENGTLAIDHVIQPDNKRYNSVFYYDNGQIMEESYCSKGITHYKAYYTNGQLRKEGSYTESAMIGAWRYYDESGNLLREIKY